VCLAAVAVLALSACTPEPRGPEPLVRGSTPTTTPFGSTEPLVIAVHASLPAPSISVRTARLVAAGMVRTWRSIDGSARPLRLAGGVVEVSRDLDAVAVVPASRVTAAVRTALVDGVDPLRRPGSYPLRVTCQEPPRPTTITVVGDMMLGRRVAAESVPGAPCDHAGTGWRQQT